MSKVKHRSFDPLLPGGPMQTGTIPVSNGELALFVRHVEVRSTGITDSSESNHVVVFGKELPIAVQTPVEYLALLGPEHAVLGFQFLTRVRSVATIGDRTVVSLSEEIIESTPVYRVGRYVSRAYLEQIQESPSAWAAQNPATILKMWDRIPELRVVAYDDPHYVLECYHPIRPKDNVMVIDTKGRSVDVIHDKPEPPQVLIMTDDPRWNKPYLAALRATGLRVRHVRRYDAAMSVLENPATCRDIRIVFASMFLYTNGVPPEDLQLANFGSRTGLVLHKRVVQHPTLRGVD